MLLAEVHDIEQLRLAIKQPNNHTRKLKHAWLPTRTNRTSSGCTLPWIETHGRCLLYPWPLNLKFEIVGNRYFNYTLSPRFFLRFSSRTRGYERLTWRTRQSTLVALVDQWLHETKVSLLGDHHGHLADCSVIGCKEADGNTLDNRWGLPSKTQGIEWNLAASLRFNYMIEITALHPNIFFVGYVCYMFPQFKKHAMRQFWCRRGRVGLKHTDVLPNISHSY